MPSKKAAAKKKASGKRTSVKRTSQKKPARSAARASSKKKPSKKKTSSKKTSSKKAARRPSSKKRQAAKTSRKKTSAKKTGTKKVASKGRTSSKKRPSVKKTPARGTSKSTASRKRVARRSDLLSSPGASAGPYQPRRGEGYMSTDQLDHFRSLLTNWKRELMEEVDRTMLHMKDEAANFPDPNDRATQESEFGLELRTRDRERKLLRKIDAALQRIEDGTYGYCAETGEEIGLRRLEARPVATLCVEAQERREHAERPNRARDDQYR